MMLRSERYKSGYRFVALALLDGATLLNPPKLSICTFYGPASGEDVPEGDIAWLSPPTQEMHDDS